eukprot:jgi/Tetstr1/430224/TSEL_020053.t1
MGFTLDDLPTFHLFKAAFRNLLGGVIDLNVMRNYIKAVPGAATAPPVITADVAERSFRTIGECAQAMLLHAGLDRAFWDWAYLHAVYLCNRQWSSSVNAIPYTLMTGRKPDLTDHEMAALALQAPTARVSKAPRNYKEAISSNHPKDREQSMDREIDSITKMETFVWISVPELRRDSPSAIIIQTAWAFAEKHDKDGKLITRKARVVVRGDQLTAGENYDDTNTYAQALPLADYPPIPRAVAPAMSVAAVFADIDNFQSNLLACIHSESNMPVVIMRYATTMHIARKQS